jgi:hypothetical protein
MATTRFLLMRHGRTDQSRPEGWSKTHLTATGRADAEAGAEFVAAHLDQLPPISHLISSPLPRSVQSAEIAGRVLGISHIEQLPEIKAFDINREPSSKYARRSESALQRILGEPGVPLVTAHRSFSSFLARRYALTTSPDQAYVKSLLDTGGVLAAGPLSEGANGLLPLFRPLPENWPGHSGTVYDLDDDSLAAAVCDTCGDPTCISDHTDDDHFRTLKRFVTVMTAGPLETRSGRRDLTCDGDRSVEWVRR